MATEALERIYKIVADASQPVRELEKLNKSVSGIDNKLAGVATAFKAAFAGATVVAAIQTVTRAVTDSIDAFDKLGKTTQKLGVSAQDFTELQHAAEMTDISTEKLAASMTKLNKAIADAASGGTSKGAEALKDLGVNIRDSSGELRNSADVFREVAQAFSEIPDGAEKATLAMQIFGKSGADLIPLLNEGAAGLEAFAEQAKALGLVISDTDTLLADQFNDNVDLMKKQFEGATNSLTSGLLPALALLSTELADGETNVSAWTAAGQEMGKVLIIIKRGLDLMNSSLEQNQTAVEDINRLTAAIFLPDATTATERNKAIVEAWDALKKNLFQTNDEIEENYKKLFHAVETDAAKLAQEAVDALNLNIDEAASNYVSTVGEKVKADLQQLADNPPEFKVAVVPEFKIDAATIEEVNRDFEKAFNTSQIETTNEVMQQVNEDLKIYSSQMETAASMNLALADSMKEVDKESSILSTAIGTTLSDAVGDFVDKLADGEFKFKDFVRTMIIEIAKLVARLQILQAIAATSFGSWAGITANAMGGAFSSLSLPHGVYNQPTTFPIPGNSKKLFASGGVGVLGEAGPEAILPLRRTQSGRLGVESTGSVPNINIHNYTSSEITARRSNEEIEIVINRVAADILRGGSRISRAMEGTYAVNRARGAP